MKPFKENNPKRPKKLSPNSYGLHGDVVLIVEETLPKDFDSLPKVMDDCVAYGEATGHAHKIFGDEGSFDMRVNKDNVIYLNVTSPVALRHQEHDPVILPPNIYRIDIQKEYDPFDKIIRQVAD